MRNKSWLPVGQSVIKFSLTFLMLAGGTCGQLRSQDSRSQEQDSSEKAPIREPISLTCYGSVKDEQGQPIPKATLIWVGSRPAAYSIPGIELKPVVTIQFSTDRSGKFRHSEMSDKEGLLSVGDIAAQSGLLVVSKPGYQLHAAALGVGRLQTDLPFEIRLKPAKPALIKLTDADGNPIAKASVASARIAGNTLPYSTARAFSTTTSEDGSCTLNANDERNRHFYVWHETLGFQCLLAKQTVDGLSLRAMKTGVVQGRFKMPQGVDLKRIVGKSIWFGSVQSKAFRGEGQDTFGWAKAIVQADGTYQAMPLALGGIQPTLSLGDDFEWVVTNGYGFPDLTDADQPLKMDFKLAKGIPLELAGIDQDGKPLTGISILGKRVDDRGKVTVYLNQQSAGQAFGIDPLQQYVIPNDFGVILRKLVPGRKNKVQVPMVLAKVVRGRAVDESGQPIAGARIECETVGGRFQLTYSSLSDRLGNFAVRQIKPGTSVRLRGSKGSLISKDLPEYRFNSSNVSDGLVVKLHRQAVAEIVGRLVDERGQPVENVEVKIRKTIVFEPESYSGVSFSLVGVPGLEQSVKTDSQGEYRFPASPEFRGMLRVQVDDARYFPFKGPVIDGARRKFEQGRITYPTFRMRRRPAQVSTTLRILDQHTGEPIANAEVAAVGVHAGAVYGKTASDGKLSTKLAQVPQLLAVRADGYPVRFQWLGFIEPEMTISLMSPSGETANREWFQRTSQNYLDPAKRLLATLKQPAADSNYYRQSLFFSALSGVEPEKFFDTLLVEDTSYEHGNSFSMFQFETLFAGEPERSLRWANGPTVEPYQKSNMLCLFALKTRDAKRKQELYAESIVALRSLVAERQAYAVSTLAHCLVIDGQVKAAQRLVREVWDASDELKAILRDQKHIEKTGIARQFLPALALVDHKAALALADLIAPNREIQSVQGSVLMSLSLVDQSEFEMLAGKYVDGDGQPLVNLKPLKFLVPSIDRLRPGLQQWPLWLAKQMPPSETRIQVLLLAAKPGADLTVRRQAIQEATATISQLPAVQQEFFYGEFTRSICDWAASSNPSEEELDSLIFESMLRRPESYETNGALEMLGVFARLLALRDPALARQLMEPAFEYTSWLYTYQTGSDFQRCHVLQSAVWIDPEWARELALRLGDESRIESPLRKTELISGVISELSRLGFARRAK